MPSHKITARRHRQYKHVRNDLLDVVPPFNKVILLPHPELRLQEAPRIVLHVQCTDNRHKSIAVEVWYRFASAAIFCGLSYLRREYAPNGSWTGSSRAATRVRGKSALQRSEHALAGAATSEPAPQAPISERIAEQQLTHGIASPARISAPVAEGDSSKDCYTIIKVGDFLLVTVVVQTQRACTMYINSARARVYRVVGESVVQKPVVDVDYTELPFTINLHEGDKHMVTVTWDNPHPAQDSKMHKYISRSLDVETELNIMHCIAQFGTSDD